MGVGQKTKKATVDCRLVLVSIYKGFILGTSFNLPSLRRSGIVGPADPQTPRACEVPGPFGAAAFKIEQREGAAFLVEVEWGFREFWRFPPNPKSPRISAANWVGL